MIRASDVAQYFLAHTEPDDDLISNLKLQKLLYYAQAVHIAAYGEPLFSDELEAWKHGPVVRSLYHLYKAYDASPIPPPGDLDESRLDDRIRKLLNFVYGEYGQYSAWKLCAMTHEEPPWIEARESGRPIASDAMLLYFGPKYGGLLGIGQKVTRTKGAVAALKELISRPSTLTFDAKPVPVVDLQNT